MYFLYVLSEIGLTGQCFMQTTSGEWSIVNIGLTVKANKEIIPSISAAHSASGCDTVAPHGVGKASIVKNLRSHFTPNTVY